MPQQTVLLVDDEEFLRRLLSRVLDAAGFSVLQAADGRAALTIANASESEPSLVVTDVHMPVMDGLAFAREFRLTRPSVPILFITGRGPDPESDPDGFPGELLRKPFQAETFLAAVSRLLALHPAR